VVLIEDRESLEPSAILIGTKSSTCQGRGMIEISRYILATMVAQTRLWPLGAAWTGNIAVFAFYTLSGYLMTRVLNERYGFSARGTVAFLLNHQAPERVQKGRPEARPWRYLQGQTELRTKRKIEVFSAGCSKGAEQFHDALGKTR
jgi:hypothetical protein